MNDHSKRRFCLFLLIIFFLPCLFAQQLPRPQGYVNDFAGVMKVQDIQTAENLAEAVKKKTGAELVIATVKSIAPYATIDDYSIALAEKWGIGEKGKDNGILLILATDEREVKIEVGYGLEGAIPDSLAGRILDTAVIPAFRQNDFSGGLLEGYKTIAAYVAKEKGVELEGYDLPKTENISSSIFSNFIFWIIVIWVLIIVISSVLRAKGIIRPGSGRGFRTGSFGSGRGGGFGSGSGFGGGSFGGGGASRRF